MKAADGRHLRDDQMIAVCLGTTEKVRHAEAAVTHLRACPACADRYGRLAQELSELRSAADAEADALFPAARLENQRAEIMARLEHLGQPARVLPFPGRSQQQLSIFTASQVRRWIAAAAAAGLLIGVTVGRMTEYVGTNTPAKTRAVVSRQVQPRPSAEPNKKPSEEEILSQLDQQLYLQPVAELEAFDAMTPHMASAKLR